MRSLYSEINVIGSIDRTSDYESTMKNRPEYILAEIYYFKLNIKSIL